MFRAGDVIEGITDMDAPYWSIGTKNLVVGVDEVSDNRDVLVHIKCLDARYADKETEMFAFRFKLFDNIIYKPYSRRSVG